MSDGGSKAKDGLEYCMGDVHSLCYNNLVLIGKVDAQPKVVGACEK